MFSLLIPPSSITSHLCLHKYSPRSCRGYLQLPIPFPELRRKNWYCCDCKLPPISNCPKTREHRDLGKKQPLVISQKVVTWEVIVWFYHSSPFLASKEKPMQHPYFQSFPCQLWHRNVCCSQPLAALPAPQPSVMGGSKSPKHMTCPKGKVCGTARSSCKLDSWTPECSSGTSNHLVGLCRQRVQWCLSSASKALNYNSSSIVKIGKNKPNPNLGSAPLNDYRI